MILRMKFNHYAGIKTPKYMLIMLFSDNFIGLDGSMNNCCIHQCKYIPCHCNRSWIVFRTPVHLPYHMAATADLICSVNFNSWNIYSRSFCLGRFVKRKSVLIKFLGTLASTSAFVLTSLTTTSSTLKPFTTSLR